MGQKVLVTFHISMPTCAGGWTLLASSPDKDSKFDALTTLSLPLNTFKAPAPETESSPLAGAEGNRVVGVGNAFRHARSKLKYARATGKGSGHIAPRAVL